jgi:ribose/xylose/arabinose/galactoside ABC-type transport system permease subunit
MMPIVILVLMLAIFGISTNGLLFSASNMTNVFNQTLSTLVCALGMVFVATMGGTDITVGSLCAMASVFGTLAANRMGLWSFIPAVLLTGLASGFLLGFLNAKCKVNSFMASLALLIAYRAIVNLNLKSASFTFPSELSIFRNFTFDVIAVIVMLAVIVFLFHYTPFGLYVRGIGENENAMSYAGVSVTKIKIIAFMISGLMAAVASLFLSARVGGVNNTFGTGFEMKVMMAMFIGGIPVQGGMGSKMYKIVIGAFTITILENGLNLSNVDGSVTQLVRGIVLLAAIWLTMFMSEKFRYGIGAIRKNV